MIVKYKKNKIRWNGQDSVHHSGKSKKNGSASKKREVDSEILDEYQQLKNKLKELKNHETELDKHLQHLENHKNELKMDDTYARYAFVTYEDLEYLNKHR